MSTYRGYLPEQHLALYLDILIKGRSRGKKKGEFSPTVMKSSAIAQPMAVDTLINRLIVEFTEPQQVLSPVHCVK